ncbi:MAG TPA: hypothetical protein VHB47_21180 [Thermoanaerobaculia bacterium]|nr:hypothetical protein [Thermoanaerobaculia bacterium]
MVGPRAGTGAGGAHGLAAPDGRVISGSDERTLRIWDLATGRTTGTLEGHWSGVYALAVLPDGRVVSGSEDHTLRIWDLATGRDVQEAARPSVADAPPA